VRRRIVGEGVAGVTTFGRVRGVVEELRFSSIIAAAANSRTMTGRQGLKPGWRREMCPKGVYQANKPHELGEAAGVTTRRGARWGARWIRRSGRSVRLCAEVCET